MTAQPEITQRDLCNRSKEIMDAVESGRSFTVTRGGHEIGELIPLRRRRRFVSRAEFVATSRNAAHVDAMPSEPIRKQRSTRSPRDPYVRQRPRTPIFWSCAAGSTLRNCRMRWPSARSPSPNSRQPTRSTPERRARRLRRTRGTCPLARCTAATRSELVSVPFDAEAARIYGRVSAAVIASGRKPRRRTVDLMIAATAIAKDLPLFTTNPEDFKGLYDLLTVVPVARPL
jgi:antitoxin (DNA-binding transcriptional repressor) of toxin-antitoxin stability system